MQKEKTVLVEVKTVYGNELVYPICKKGKIFASMSGKKTLLPNVIHSIKELGYSLETRKLTF